MGKERRGDMGERARTSGEGRERIGETGEKEREHWMSPYTSSGSHTPCTDGPITVATPGTITLPPMLGIFFYIVVPTFWESNTIIVEVMEYI